ncbi:hypothetical protein ENC22_16970 [Hahella sp. KA22]|uniref:hypothetical protein n=1 Tax=Hahella sp. KA22 TaxID=1628392 RepID=UPI000FDE4A32|nr:hypothetical protein [Hahella sp. KA22]AZZ92800.1 hypothetical protein ENC22_16970 [Hahella sp. KA22]
MSYDKPVKLIAFHEAKTALELLDLIRHRYQMLANDIDTLNGILMGFSMANGEFGWYDFAGDFRRYLMEKYSLPEDYPFSWTTIIKEQAVNCEYQVPVFFECLAAHRKLEIQLLGEATLTRDQRYFDFERMLRQTNVDYPSLPLNPPPCFESGENSRSQSSRFLL